MATASSCVTQSARYCALVSAHSCHTPAQSFELERRVSDWLSHKNHATLCSRAPCAATAPHTHHTTDTALTRDSATRHAPTSSDASAVVHRQCTGRGTHWATLPLPFCGTSCSQHHNKPDSIRMAQRSIAFVHSIECSTPYHAGTVPPPARSPHLGAGEMVTGAMSHAHFTR